LTVSDPVPGYQTKLQTVAVDGVADLQIRSLLDRQQFWDPDDEAGRRGISSASWPLFGMLWPSSSVLAARLALRPVDPQERILEIGCGLALPSLVAHRRGANITASDNHPLAESFLQANAKLNGLPSLAYRHADWRASALPVKGSVEGRFDLIVGSDLLYERDAQGDAAAFIDRHAGLSAEVWIVDPDRSNRPAFNRSLAALGFSVNEERLDRSVGVGNERYKGRLLVYRRAG
jgi:predicted nicotinamide N-methyase